MAWTNRGGRAGEIAQAVGGEAITVFPRILGNRKLAPLRYAVSAAITFVVLIRKRPSAVIVTSPPVFAALCVAVYCRFNGVPFAMDNHPTAFGAKDHLVSQRLLPLTRALVKRAAATLVTTQHWVDEVERWHGRGLIVHEAPPSWTPPASNTEVEGRPRIVYVGIFGGDEPVAEVVAASRLVPEFDVVITGALHRAPEGLVESAPENVTFSGFLDEPQYVAALRLADVVCSFTTEPTSVMRAAYEAVYAARPLVVSETEASREFFPCAVFTENTATAIAEAWRTAILDRDDLLERAQEAREEQLARWEGQRMAVMGALGLVSSP